MPANDKETGRLIARERDVIAAEELRIVQEAQRLEQEQLAGEQAEIRAKATLLSKNKDSWIDTMLAVGAPGSSLFKHETTIGRLFAKRAIVDGIGWKIIHDRSAQLGHYTHEPETSNDFLILSADGDFYYQHTSTAAWTLPAYQMPLEHVVEKYEMDRILGSMQSIAEENRVPWQPLE